MSTRQQFNAYYFAFDATGDPKIDAILKAVAGAGKGAHHTQDWEELGYIKRIQDAAAQAALCVPAPEAPGRAGLAVAYEAAVEAQASRIAELEAALREINEIAFKVSHHPDARKILNIIDGLASTVVPAGETVASGLKALSVAWLLVRLEEIVDAVEEGEYEDAKILATNLHNADFSVFIRRAGQQDAPSEPAVTKEETQ